MAGYKHPVGSTTAGKRNLRAVLRLPDPDTVEVPPLPERPDGIEWHDETLAWWDEIWYSPMAAEWVDSDVHGLFRLAILIDNFYDGSGHCGLSTEIRLCQQSYGLTPYDRRRLEWTIEQSEDAKHRGAQRRFSTAQALQPSPGDDPRLRIVE